MQVNTKDSKEATNKQEASARARFRSNCNKTLHSRDVRLKVEKMALVMSMLYYGKVYEDWHKKSAGVKVQNAEVKNKKQLAIMEQAWASEGITKVVTPQGVIYKVA